jgi:hypothetical protein
VSAAKETNGRYSADSGHLPSRQTDAGEIPKDSAGLSGDLQPQLQRSAAAGQPFAQDGSGAGTVPGLSASQTGQPASPQPSGQEIGQPAMPQPDAQPGAVQADLQHLAAGSGGGATTASVPACRCGAGPHESEPDICARGHALRGNRRNWRHGLRSDRPIEVPEPGELGDTCLV